MGQMHNTAHTLEQKYEILKKAGKLTGPFKKPFADYKAFDHHELGLLFDGHKEETPAVAPAPVFTEPVIITKEALVEAPVEVPKEPIVRRKK